MDTSWSFVNNLSIPAGKYLKWLDYTSVSKSNIIGVDIDSNLNINSALTGDIYLNSNNSGSSTFINYSNSQNVIVSSKLAIGISDTSNINANLTIAKNGWIGVNDTTGHLSLAGSSSLDGNAKIVINGSNEKSGQIELHAGNVPSGKLNFYTGEESLKLQILSSGELNVSPDGTTIRLSVSDLNTTISSRLLLTNTESSNSPFTGALQIAGGLGVQGDTYIRGNLQVESVGGNLNFNNSRVSTSYSTGSFFIHGGFGIACSTPASSVTSGGGLSVAGGLALGQNAIIGGTVIIKNSTESLSSQTGSLVAYGGVGINGQTNIRSSSVSQIRISPVISGNETSLYFSSRNDYTTTGSWTIGHNINSIGSDSFGFANADNGTYMILDKNNYINILKNVNVKNTIDIQNNSSDNYISFSNTDGSVSWSLGKISDGNDFHISRYDVTGIFKDYSVKISNDTGEVYLLGTCNSSSSSEGGGLTVYGGVGVAKDLFVGGNIFANGTVNITGTLVGSDTSASSFAYLTLTGTDEALNLTSGALLTYGGITIQCSTDASSITDGGSLLAAGGASFGRRVFVGDSLFVNNLIATNNITTTNETVGNQRVSNSLILNNTVSNSVVMNSQITNNSVLNLVSSTITSGSITATNITNTNLSSTNSSVSNLKSETLTANNIIVSELTNLTYLYSQSSSLSNSTLTNVTASNVYIDTGVTSKSIVVSGGSLSATFNSNTIANLVTTGGNIGIDTSTPLYKLDVSTSISGDGVRVKNPVNSTVNIVCDTKNPLTVFQNSTGMGLYTMATHGPIYIYQNGEDNYTTFSTNGNVGINTKTPVYRLDVNGTLRGLSVAGVSNTENNISNTIGSFNFSSDIVLSNSTRNTLFFNSVGVNSPTFSTRSIGSKIVLSPQITSSSLDYALGVENNNAWYSVPNIGNGYKWYQGTFNSMSLKENSTLQLNTTTISVNSTTAAFVSFGGVSISHTSNSISATSGGGLTIAGGTAIQKDLYVGGNIFQASSATGTINNLCLSSTENATGVGSGGGLSVSGGMSVSKDCYIGAKLAVGNTTTISPQQTLELSAINYSSNEDGGLRISTKNPISTTDTSYRYIDLRLRSDSTNYYSGSIFGTLSGGTNTEQEYIKFSQDSTTTILTSTLFTKGTPCSNSSTASVVFSGGLSIDCFTNATDVSNGGSLTVAGGASIAGDLIVGGSILYSNAAQASSTFAYLTLTATDQSTDVGNGALVTFGGISIQTTADATSATAGYGLTVAGGVGIGSSLYVGGNSYLPSVTSVYNTTTNLISSNQTVSNELVFNSSISNLIVTNGLKATSSSNTIGSIFTTGGNVGINTTSPTATLTIVNDSNPNLDIGSVSTNSSRLRFMGGVSDNWAYIQAGSNSTTAGNLRISQFNSSTGSLKSLEIYTSTTSIFGALSVIDTRESTNASTASLVSYGGVSISMTSNATSVSQGGALTVAGGLGVSKDVYVGGTITSSSDRNLKTNIKPIDTVLDKIDKINCITYNTREDINNKVPIPVNYIGFIAQDFEEHFSELLRRESVDSFYSLDYTRVTVLLMQCIKELKKEIIELKK